ncbi:MAG: hypothetical protein HC767_15585 [Akkermansiaceae bacterium]|nr:hypothetical protein [Akkermansiaceae bacterium]
MIRPVDAILEFLSIEQARGVTHVHLDEGARDTLRSLFLLSKKGGAAASPSPQSLPSPAKAAAPRFC